MLCRGSPGSLFEIFPFLHGGRQQGVPSSLTRAGFIPFPNFLDCPGKLLIAEGFF